jgi:hypothetical protein
MSFGKMITLIDITETTTSQDEEGFVKKEDNIIASTRAYREERRPSNSTSRNKYSMPPTPLCQPGIKSRFTLRAQ